MSNKLAIPEERILTEIILIRDEKVILDVTSGQLVWRRNKGLKTGRKKEFRQVPTRFYV